MIKILITGVSGQDGRILAELWEGRGAQITGTTRKTDKEYVKKKLSDNGVGSRDMYPRVNKQKAFKHHSQYHDDFPVSKEIEDRGIWLPSSLTLTDEQIEFICDILS